MYYTQRLSTSKQTEKQRFPMEGPSSLSVASALLPKSVHHQCVPQNSPEGGGQHGPALSVLPCGLT